MKIVKIYSVLIAAILLMAQCSREDDPDLYQVSYGAITDSMAFHVSPKIIDVSDKIADTIRFSYTRENAQELDWKITLQQGDSKKTLEFKTATFSPKKDFWIFNTSDVDKGGSAFDKKTDILVQVDADISFTAGVITFKTKK